MNIEDIRFLFTSLIQIIPVIVSISLIAFFAFPSEGIERKEDVKKFYKISLFIFGLIILLAFMIVTILAIDLVNLTDLVSNNEAAVNLHVILSVVVLFVVPIFTVAYLFIVAGYRLKYHI